MKISDSVLEGTNSGFAIPVEHPSEVSMQKLIFDTMRSDLSSSEIQEICIISITDVLDCQGCALLLLEDGIGELIYHHSGENSLERIYNLHPDWDNGLVEKALHRREILSVPDISETSSNILFRSFVKQGSLSFICIPLDYEDQLIGCLALFKPVGEAFSSQEMNDISLIASSLSFSFFNSRLVRQLRRDNANLEVKRWQLLNSRNILRALFDNIPTSIYNVDIHYNLTAINSHRSKQTQQHPRNLVGRRCYEALQNREDPCPDCHVVETLYSGKTTTRLKRVWQDDRGPQEWEISTYPIIDDEQRVIQCAVIEEDVTEKRRLESTLAQSEKLAAVGQLAAGIAHEINNPLTAIVANAQLLQREIPQNDDRQELVDLISRAGARAAQVVRNLLDLARKEQYEFASTDVNETILKARELLQHELITHAAELTLDLEADLPKILASANHLQGVWMNLITNALDACNGRGCEIRITSRRKTNDVHIIVADKGQGIPPEKLNLIFEPFYTTKAPGHGTGLGLSVCHRVIKQHEGRIIVDSEINNGTQFTVILPIR
jgi:two-component system, NtrC family, sensor kinase